MSNPNWYYDNVYLQPPEDEIKKDDDFDSHEDDSDSEDCDQDCEYWQCLMRDY